MRDIKGYEGLYAVTSCGKVWSYRRQKFISPDKDKKGYLHVSLCKDGKRKRHTVHRLVAEAYIPNPEGKAQVNHLNEIKTANYINNLSWATSKENNNYGTRNIRIGKSGEKPVYCVELDKVFSSATSAARELGLAANAICGCCKGRYGYKTHGGYHWKYAE